MREYRQTENGKKAYERKLKVWKARYNTDKVFREQYLKKHKEKRKGEPYKKINRKAVKKYLENKRKSNEFREEEKIRLKEYRKTGNGKLATAKHHEIRKGYQHKLLAENIIEGESVILHHITDNEVIFIPKDLHGLYGWNPKKTHRENLQYIVNQIYDIDLQEMGYYKK